MAFTIPKARTDAVQQVEDMGRSRAEEGGAGLVRAKDGAGEEVPRKGLEPAQEAVARRPGGDPQPARKLSRLRHAEAGTGVQGVARSHPTAAEEQVAAKRG